MRIWPSRSNRRDSMTFLPATSIRLCAGVAMPARRPARRCAISSHVSALQSSVSFGNLAVERWPCRSITDAFGPRGGRGRAGGGEEDAGGGVRGLRGSAELAMPLDGVRTVAVMDREGDAVEAFDGCAIRETAVDIGRCAGSVLSRRHPLPETEKSGTGVICLFYAAATFKAVENRGADPGIIYRAAIGPEPRPRRDVLNHSAVFRGNRRRPIFKAR